MWQKSCAVLGRAALFALLPFWSTATALPSDNWGALGPAQQCDMAAAQAAQSSQVPLSILQSIARVESGKSTQGNFVAWPWALNVAGQGHFFANKAEAIDFASLLIAQQNINFDVGCFQINLRWHSKGFTSLEDAFDPMSNAAYAASFLTQLYAEMGNWPDAVAAYHSRSPEHSEPYLTKVKSVWQQLQQDGTTAAAPAPPLAAPAPRTNGFPLLVAGEGANGSLVPQNSTQTSRFSLR